MAVQQGYGKMAGANSLVFAYDTTDTKNSFKGEPTVNLYGDINTSSSIRPSRTEYDTSNWTANFPAPPENIGRVYKHTSGALNSTWSGNSYGYTLKSYSYLANVTYTLSAWVYVSADCNITALHNSMEGTTLTDTTNRFYDLNNKGTWQQIIIKCNSSTSISGNAIPVYPSRSGVTDGSFSGFYAWGGAKLEALNRVTPYTVGTRSATEGLIDLTGNRSADLSNTSFDANGDIEFDGTDDRIHIGTDLNFNNNSFTTEAVIYWDGNSTDTFFGYGDGGGEQRNIHWRIYDTGQVRFDFYSNSINSVTGAIAPNTFYHLLVTYNAATDSCICYRNGEILMQGNAGPYLGVDSASNGYIGAWTPASQPFGGKIPVFKIYNEALTASQVQANFNNYRKRFSDLSNYYDNTTDGGRWIRWWWYTGVGWPGHETEALGHPFGTFDSSSHYGFQRLPEGLEKEQVELLAKDGDGNIYKWDFASPSATAQQVWDSFTTGAQGRWNNAGDAWNPEVIAGSFFNTDQDAWQYRESEGVVSFLLDDDTCDCKSTLNAGHAMCGSGWNQTYAQPDGAYLRYGVDTLNDGGCRGPVPERTLELYYRLK
jgi:hypothetical protein